VVEIHVQNFDSRTVCSQGQQCSEPTQNGKVEILRQSYEKSTLTSRGLGPG